MPYYLTSTANIPADRVDMLFSKRGNWTKAVTDKPIDFIYIDRENNTKYKPIEKLPSDTKNFIDDDKRKISRKNDLYTNLARINKTYLLEQHRFDWRDAVRCSKLEQEIERVRRIFESQPNKIWIYKPVAGYSGMNIKRFNSSRFHEFNTYIRKFIAKQRSGKPSKPYKIKEQGEWVLQEYVASPLLYQKKKMHIRPIFLYHKTENSRGEDIKVGYILDKIIIAHAIEDYKFSDFSNEKIHDTHIASTPSGTLFFEQDMSDVLSPAQISSVKKQVIELAGYVFDLVNSRCYPENKHCYETFGMDIIIDQDLKIKLMEVQITKASYGKLGMPLDERLYPEFYNMSEYILENALERVVDKYFPPTKKFKRSNGFVEFYRKPLLPRPA